MTATTALTKALVLALLAPDQSRSARATALAETIAQGCTAKQIASAKRNAIKLARGGQRMKSALLLLKPARQAPVLQTQAENLISNLTGSFPFSF